MSRRTARLWRYHSGAVPTVALKDQDAKNAFHKGTWDPENEKGCVQSLHSSKILKEGRIVLLKICSFRDSLLCHVRSQEGNAGFVYRTEWRRLNELPLSTLCFKAFRSQLWLSTIRARSWFARNIDVSNDHLYGASKDGESVSWKALYVRVPCTYVTVVHFWGAQTCLLPRMPSHMLLERGFCWI